MTDYKEYIYEIYREKSFHKAAQKLYVSQSWLSVAVKKTETELGCLLFDRSTNPISLTDAGRYYIDCIEQIMQIEQEMRQHFKELAAGTELRVGSSMFFCTYVLPALLADFKELNPQITLTYFEGSNQILTKKLLNGEIDLLLEAERPDNPKLQTIPWGAEELMLAVPSHYRINNELADYRYTFEEFLHRHEPDCAKPPVTLTHFQHESFIFLKKGNDSHDRSLQFCRNAHFTPHISMYCTQMMTAYYLVCEGRGIAFLRSTIPEYVIPTDKIVFYQLAEPDAVRNIYLSFSAKKHGSVRQELIDFILEKGSLSKNEGALR